MTIITDKQFTALIADINTGTTTRREQLDTALRFAAFHAAVHRNSDPALRLFAVVGRESNLRGMARWLSTNAPIAFKDEVPFFHEKMWKLNYKECSALEIEREIQGALPFWRVKAKDEAVEDTPPMDVMEELRAVLAKVANQVKANAKPDGKRAKREVKHLELVDQVAAILNNKTYA